MRSSAALFIAKLKLLRHPKKQPLPPRRLVKICIAVAGWLAGTMTAYAAPHVSSSRSEAAARRVCAERARAAHHRVLAVRSINKKSKDHFTLTLRVEGTKRLLICDYNGRSGAAQFHWQ